MPDPDPDKLLRLLDAELALKRTSRTSGGGNRLAFRLGSIVFLLILFVVALLALQYFASEFGTHRPAPAPSADAAQP